MVVNQVHSTTGASPTPSSTPGTSNLNQGNRALGLPASVARLLSLSNGPETWSVTVTSRQYQKLQQVARNEQKLGAALEHLAQEREREATACAAAHRGGLLSDGDLAYANERVQHYQNKLSRLTAAPDVAELLLYLRRQ